MVRPLRSDGQQARCRLRSGTRNFAASCTPLRAGARYGPSRWMPSTPGTPSAIAASTAAIARAHHVEIVADQRRQEAGRAEAAMRGADRRIVSTVGASLNSTPPPPLTWQSMKPGSRKSAVRGRAIVGVAHARVVARRRPRRCGRPRRAPRRRRGIRRRVSTRPLTSAIAHQTVSVTLLQMRRRVRIAAAPHRQRIDRA